MKIDILYSGIGFGPVYLKYLNELVVDTTVLQFDLSQEYKQNVFGKTPCPKCKKTNQVYKIRYGDAPIVTLHINKNGDTTYSSMHKGFYEAGSCISTPQSASWYCDRDKIEF